MKNHWFQSCWAHEHSSLCSSLDLCIELMIILLQFCRPQLPYVYLNLESDVLHCWTNTTWVGVIYLWTTGCRALSLLLCCGVQWGEGSPSGRDMVVGLCDWVWSWWSIGHWRNWLCCNAVSVGIDSARLHKEGVCEFRWKTLPGPFFWGWSLLMGRGRGWKTRSWKQKVEHCSLPTNLIGFVDYLLGMIWSGGIIQAFTQSFIHSFIHAFIHSFCS